MEKEERADVKKWLKSVSAAYSCRRCRPTGDGFLLLFLRHSKIHASASVTENRLLIETRHNCNQITTYLCQYI